jgi:hypothetical protein
MAGISQFSWIECDLSQMHHLPRMLASLRTSVGLSNNLISGRPSMLRSCGVILATLGVLAFTALAPAGALARGGGGGGGGGHPGGGGGGHFSSGGGAHFGNAHMGGGAVHMGGGAVQMGGARFVGGGQFGGRHFRSAGIPVGGARFATTGGARFAAAHIAAGHFATMGHFPGMHGPAHTFFRHFARFVGPGVGFYPGYAYGPDYSDVPDYSDAPDYYGADATDGSTCVLVRQPVLTVYGPSWQLVPVCYGY